MSFPIEKFNNPRRVNASVELTLRNFDGDIEKLFSNGVINTRRLVSNDDGKIRLEVSTDTDQIEQIDFSISYGDEIEIDDDEVKKIYEIFCMEYPLLQRINSFNSYKLKTIIQGQIQQGKSRLGCILLWVFRYYFKYDMVSFVLMNSIHSLNKFIMEDVVNFNQSNVTIKHKYPLAILPISNFDMKNISVDMPFLVAMTNNIQIKKLRDVTMTYKNQFPDNDKFILIVDEADTIIKNVDEITDSSKVGTCYNELKLFASQLIEITATPFACINRKDVLFKTQLIKMESPPLTYRGIHNLTFKLPFTSDECMLLRKGDYNPLMTRIEDMNTTSNNFFEDVPELPYTTVLFNVSSNTNNQKTCAKYIYTQFDDTFIFNSKTNYIQVIRDGISINSPYRYLNELYNHFENEYQMSGIKKRYAIVSGLNASRSISFRPSYDKGLGGLNFFVYVDCESTHCASRIQYFRLCGNFPDWYPSGIVYGSERNEHKLKHELNNIDNMMSSMGNMIGDSRLSIEGLSLIYTGKHDRKNVDDTSLKQKTRLLNTEFSSIEDIKNRLGIADSEIIILTEPIREVQNHWNFENTHESTIQAKIRETLISEFRLTNNHSICFQNNNNGILQMVWSDTRYNELFSLSTRFNSSKSYLTRHVAEIIRDKIYIITWKRNEYLNRDLQWGNETHFEIDKFYVFQTTRNTWRVGSNSRNDITFGILSH